MTNLQIDNRLKKLAVLEAQAKELEKEIEAIKDDIRGSMADAETLETNHFIVRYTPYITNRFDTKAFKTAHAKLYNDFTKETISRRFTYKAL